MRFLPICAAALTIAALLPSVASAETVCHFEPFHTSGGGSAPVSGWVKSGYGCGSSFSGSAATLDVGTPPQHGELKVNSDARSFMYTPTKGYKGPDTFTLVFTGMREMHTYLNYTMDVR